MVTTKCQILIDKLHSFAGINRIKYIIIFSLLNKCKESVHNIGIITFPINEITVHIHGDNGTRQSAQTSSSVPHS